MSGIEVKWHELGGPCCCWVICSQLVEAPPQVRSQEHRSRQRTQNLERQVTKMAPLFAEQLVTDELERRPRYFAGEALAERQQAKYTRGLEES